MRRPRSVEHRDRLAGGADEEGAEGGAEGHAGEDEAEGEREDTRARGGGRRVREVGVHRGDGGDEPAEAALDERPDDEEPVPAWEVRPEARGEDEVEVCEEEPEDGDAHDACAPVPV